MSWLRALPSGEISRRAVRAGLQQQNADAGVGELARDQAATGAEPTTITSKRSLTLIPSPR